MGRKKSDWERTIGAREERLKAWLESHEKKLLSEGVATRKGGLLVFKNREELKWYWHAKMCRGLGSDYEIKFVLPMIDIKDKLSFYGLAVETPEVFEGPETLVTYLEAVRKEAHMDFGKDLEEFETWKKTQVKVGEK